MSARGWMRRLSWGARAVVKAPILAWRYGISPLTGPSCRFVPSCSQYACEALDRHGLRRGVWLALRRVARCHPWHPGGEDPVPEGNRG